MSDIRIPTHIPIPVICTHEGLINRDTVLTIYHRHDTMKVYLGWLPPSLSSNKGVLSPGVPQVWNCLLDRLLSDQFTHLLTINLSINLMLLPTLPRLLSSNKDHTLYSSNKGVLFQCVPQFVNPMSFAPSLASRLPQHSAFNPPTLISSFHTQPVLLVTRECYPDVYHNL